MERKNPSFGKNAATKCFWFLFVGLLLLFALLCLYRLGDGPIADWDEARHGVSGYEMLRNKEWIVTTYGYQIDYYNLKPPLSEWFIALGYTIFGFTPFGMRIYSAVAMILAALICGIFAYRFGGKISALLALLYFSGATPLLASHCARHADADSIYVLFYTIAVLSLCKYAQIGACKKGDFYLYISCLAFSFAFLAKSWHAGCIGVLVLAYLVLSKRLFRFTLKNWALCGLCAFGPIAIWAILRIAKDGTTFFRIMLSYDLLERSAAAIEGHVGGFDYYLNYLWDYKSVLIMAILGAFTIPLLWEKEKRGTVGILWLAVTLPLALFSAVQTKLFWYIFCIFPPLILLAALGTAEIVRNVKKIWMGLLCIAIPIGMMLVCVRSNWWLVSANPPESNLANLVSRTEDFSGRRILNGESGAWAQSEFLCLELAGDMIPVSGGIAEWSADDTAYLFLQKENLPSVEAEYEVVSEGARFCLLAHPE